MKRVIFAALYSLGLLCAGCAGQTSSGVLERDQGSYFVSVQTVPIPFGGGSADSRRVAYKEAKEFCSEQGKAMSVLNEASGPVTVNLTFKCSGSDNQGAK